MADDLVKRLRDLSYNQGHDLPDKAADRIENLERENNDTALHLYAFASRIEKLEDELHHCFHRINELQAALRGVIAIADRDCPEFRFARKALENEK